MVEVVSTAQRLAMLSTLPAADEEPPAAYYGSNHQLSLGLGLAIYGFLVGERGGAFLLAGETVILDAVLDYRYRINEWLAAGGGMLLHFLPGADASWIGGAATGGLRAYVYPDIVYVDADLLVGFPIVVGGIFSVGVALPVGRNVSINLENQLVLGWAFLPIGVGYWQPVLAVEFGL